MKTRALFDWSTMAYICMHQVNKPEYKARPEMEVYQQLLAGLIYSYMVRFKIDEPIFCLDVPSGTGWRTPFYDEWYKTNVDYWKSRDEAQTWYIKLDGKILLAWLNPSTMVWNSKTVTDTKLSDEGTDLMDEKDFIFFEGGNTPAWIMEQYPESPAHVYDHPDAPGLRQFIPTYKGSRSRANWKHGTPREDFKEHTEALAYNLGKLFGAKVVKVPWAEADDVVAVASTLETATETIILSSDQDLHQLLNNGMFVKYFDVGKHIFTQKDEHKCSFDLYAKILGGDTSDDIAGVTIKGRKKPFPLYGTKMVEGQETVHKGKGTYTWLVAAIEALKCKKEDIWQKLQKKLYDKQTKNSFFRNLILVNLKAIPATLQEQIIVALAEPVVSGPAVICDAINIECERQLSWYGITDIEKRVIDNQAFEDRRQDISDGYLESKVGDE